MLLYSTNCKEHGVEKFFNVHFVFFTMRKTREAFIWIINILNKTKIPYRIEGGFAAITYGSKRTLADIDIDVPDKCFRKILSNVKKYIVKGANRYKDKNWDVLGLELKYKGQEIGLVGSDTAKIFDKTKGRWIKFKVDFSKVTKKKICGKIANIIRKQDLIYYKNKIARRVDIKDVRELSH